MGFLLENMRARLLKIWQHGLWHAALKMQPCVVVLVSGAPCWSSQVTVVERVTAGITVQHAGQWGLVVGVL